MCVLNSLPLPPDPGSPPSTPCCALDLTVTECIDGCPLSLTSSQLQPMGDSSKRSAAGVGRVVILSEGPALSGWPFSTATSLLLLLAISG